MDVLRSGCASTVRARCNPRDHDLCATRRGRTLGVNIQVMQPGQPNCRYHSEPVQEDFLVLHGECIVILDGEERPLRAVGLRALPARAPSTSSWAPATGRAPC